MKRNGNPGRGEQSSGRTHGTGCRTLAFLLAFTLLFSAFLSFARAEADSDEAILESGLKVNDRMRFVSAGDNTENWEQANNIKAIRMADSLPDGFVPSEKNTVSIADSRYPVYIFFDNEDDAGIIYFYTEAGRIVMNPDSGLMFAQYPMLTDISGVADWDASRVKSMYAMFSDAKSLPDALALRNWDTSSVTDMRFMFSGASAMTAIDVSGWNTGNVVSMANMFQVGESWQGNGQLRVINGLGNLDVSNVMDMTCMFYGAGQMKQYDVADWDVSKVTSMNHMFGDNFSLVALDLSRWDVSSLQTVYCMFDDNHSLKTIGDVSHWNTANLIDAGAWLNDAITFIGDINGVLDLSGWDTSNLKSAGEMLLGTKVRVVDISGWTFDSMTNDPWEGAGTGIYYEYGNASASLRGFGQMFGTMWKLAAVYISEKGLDSFNRAVENGVNVQDMWLDSKCTGFTIK